MTGPETESRAAANLPVPAAPKPDLTIEDVLAHYRAGDSALLGMVNRFGGLAESQFQRLPPEAQRAARRAVERALMVAYRACASTEIGTGRRHWSASDRAHRALAVLSGGIGGLFGAAGYSELPLAITTILRSIRAVARDYGYDPDDPDIAKECLAVFASGGPGLEDDGADTAFLAARIALTGGSLERIVARVAARLSVVAGQKIGTQALPLLGAVGGAAVNYAYMNFYTEMAHVHFGLKRLAEAGDPAVVMADFRRRAALQRR